MSIKLYSFDVFDTLITRKTATPKGIFALMQKELECDERYNDMPEHLRKNFYYLRIQGEEIARNTFLSNEIKEITLEQIYQAISTCVCLSKQQMQSLMQLETNLEYENCVGIENNISYLKALVKDGCRVILLSNMYLDEHTVRRILVKCDDVFKELPLYVSSTCKKTKGTETLYYYVKEQEQVEFSQWEHMGDHPVLDCKIPQRIGMNVHPASSYSLEPIEEKIIEEHESNYSLQLLIGGARFVRGKGISNYSYRVGAGFAGILLYPYILWVLNQCMEQKITHLYFIARDGYLLKEIADKIIAGHNLNITTSYLYGSRKAWRLPSVSAEAFDMDEFLKWNYKGQIGDYKKLAKIFEFSVEELREFVPAAVDCDLEFAGSFREKIYNHLIQNEKAVGEKISKEQKDKRERVVSYLKQEITSCEEQKYAFVDLIGSGYSQRCLHKLMEEWTSQPVRTFFYRLDYCKICEGNENYSFYPNRMKMGNIIEVLCGATHGQTLDYTFDGSWKPVFGRDEGEFLKAYGFEFMEKGIVDFVEFMIQDNWEEAFALCDLAVPTLLIKEFAQYTDSDLYDYISDMPYSIRGQDGVVETFAPRLSRKDLENIFWKHRDKGVERYYNGYSLEFSLLRLNEEDKKYLEELKNRDSIKDETIFCTSSAKEKKEPYICKDDYDLLGRKIVIYGAGKRGQLLYKQLTEVSNERSTVNDSKVILWVDSNYLECQQNGLNVDAPIKILDTCFDQIVIPIVDKNVAEEIKNTLINMGVPAYKILWMIPQK